MRHSRGKKQRIRRQRGASLLEAMIALCILFLLFFDLLQIFHWSVAELFCEYAAHYSAKGLALGYRPELAWRSGRVAAIGISGPLEGGDAIGGEERELAERYMTRGDESGIRYRYWLPRANSEIPELRLRGRSDLLQNDIGVISSTVELHNAPLLHPNLATPLGIAEPPSPSATVRTRDYSRLYLEE